MATTAEARSAASSARAASQEVAQRINLSLDTSKRPLAGPDVERWQAKHRLMRHDVIYALGLQNVAKYNALLRSSEVGFATELLIRLYDRFPQHAPWTTVTPKEAFEIIYGDVLRDFEGTPFAKDVRLALYRRMTQAFGRHVSTAYRWDQSDGNAKISVKKILSIVCGQSNPRDALEATVRQMFKVRGKDFDAEVPLPTRDSPPQPRKRGRRARQDPPAQATTTKSGGGKLRTAASAPVAGTKSKPARATGSRGAS